MKFKIDEETGFIEVQDGKPVIVRDDGSEEAYDVLAKISELNQENASRRHDNNTLKTEKEKLEGELKAYKDLGSSKEIKAKLDLAEKGEHANDQVKELSQKVAQQEAQIEILTQQAKDEQTKSEKLTSDIYRLTVGQAFATSKFLSKKRSSMPRRH